MTQSGDPKEAASVSKMVDWLRHADRQQFVFERLGTEPWITVYEEIGALGSLESGALFSALVPNALVPNVMADTTWDISIGAGRPGFTEYGEGRIEYVHFDPAEPQPLVLARSFDCNRDGYLELLEEFRLFHNLFHEVKTNKYFCADDNGDEEEIARISLDKVEVKLRALRQFCAVKGAHLAIYFDVVRHSSVSLLDLGLTDGLLVAKKSDLVTFEVRIGDLHGSGSRDPKVFSRLLGKKLFKPLPLEKCGLPPYDERRQYVDFIVGADADGNPKTFTCDPEKLADYFGKNQGAPNFLTPVFFQREVLVKYYSQASRYSVEDSLIRCAGSWILPIDNNLKNYVVVFLGDLGQSLSHKEQVYWKSYNVPPDGTISGTTFRRSFLAEWAEAENADLRFRAKLKIFNDEWKQAMGWPLFIELADGDKHLLEGLRIPLANDQGEFDGQVLALTKSIIDSLNEKELAKGLGELPEDAKGILKFERFLESRGVKDLGEHIAFLRTLQALRSSGVGHRKGRGYDKIALSLGINEDDLREVFERILLRTLDLLDVLTQRFLRGAPPPNPSVSGGR